MSKEFHIDHIDLKKASKPATKADILQLMMMLRINALLNETALLAIATGDEDLLNRKLDQLEETGKEMTAEIQKFADSIAANGADSGA